VYVQIDELSPCGEYNPHCPDVSEIDRVGHTGEGSKDGMGEKVTNEARIVGRTQPNDETHSEVPGEEVGREENRRPNWLVWAAHYPGQDAVD